MVFLTLSNTLFYDFLMTSWHTLSINRVSVARKKNTITFRLSGMQNLPIKGELLTLERNGRSCISENFQ